MTQEDIQRFAELCRQDRALCENDGDSIGTYNEKRLHRIFKRYITEDADCYEKRVGRYVADVLCDGTFTEIQTGSFRSLTSKVAAYIESGEGSVCVLYPVICEKTLIRADKDTGEIIRTSRSPKRGSAADVLGQMYYLRDLVGEPRFCVRVMGVNAEEYRFSEAQRYRKEGRYDNDLRPTELVFEQILRTTSDYRALLPQALVGVEFTVTEFSSATRIKNRKAYSALNFLTYIGVLQKRMENRKSFYKIIEN